MEVRTVRMVAPENKKEFLKEETMTVGGLIEELKKYRMDTPVVADPYDCGERLPIKTLYDICDEKEGMLVF